LRALAFLLLLLPCLGAALPCEPPLWHKEPLRSAASPHDVRQARIRTDLDSILRGPDFQDYRCKETWVPREAKKPPQEKDAQPQWLKAFSRRLDRLAELVGMGMHLGAEAIRWGLIGLALFLVGFLAWRSRGLLGRIPALISDPTPLRGRLSPIGRPQEEFRRAAFQVESLLSAGDLRGALGLLYRATLWLCISQGVDFPRGACERECLERARQARRQGTLGEGAWELLRAVVKAWERGAWAGRWPEAEAVRVLLGSWDRVRSDLEAVP